MRRIAVNSMRYFINSYILEWGARYPGRAIFSPTLECCFSGSDIGNSTLMTKSVYPITPFGWIILLAQNPEIIRYLVQSSDRGRLPRTGYLHPKILYVGTATHSRPQAGNRPLRQHWLPASAATVNITRLAVNSRRCFVTLYIIGLVDKIPQTGYLHPHFWIM